MLRRVQCPYNLATAQKQTNINDLPNKKQQKMVKLTRACTKYNRTTSQFMGKLWLKQKMTGNKSKLFNWSLDFSFSAKRLRSSATKRLWT